MSTKINPFLASEFDDVPEENFQEENYQQSVPHSRIHETQAQVQEVTGILKKNVECILQRDEKLSELDDRADNLKYEATEFGKQTGKFKRKYWWNNCKMLAVLIFICLVILVIILVWAVDREQKREEEQQQTEEEQNTEEE